MKLAKILFSFAPAAISLLLLSNVSAATLFSNLGEPEELSSDLPVTTRLWASDFYTGGSTSQATGFNTHLINSNAQTRNFLPSLYSDNGGVPGTLVGSFLSIAVPGGGNGNFSTSSAAPISLSANTTYWVVFQGLEDSPSGAISWQGTFSNTTDPGSLFSTVPTTGLKASNDGGASYSGGGTSNLLYSITGTVIPEPNTFTLLLVGLTGMAFRIRPSRRSLAELTE